MKKLFLLLFLVGAVSAADAPARPNILWIIGDDLGAELGCYGHPAAQTPRLDRLAAEGVRYTRFYTTAPVCSASRSAFMTGMYAQSIHAQNHRTAKKDKQPLPEGVRLLTDWFRDAGYLTSNLVEFPPELGFKATGKTDWNFVYDGQPFDTRRWADLVESKKPFWAQINFNEPHRLFKAPHIIDPAKVVLPPFYPDLPEVRADWAAYLDDVAQLDRKVGAVLDRLQADGLADNTIVIFFGDNGRCHIRDKQFCYEEGLRVPLLIRWPKNFPAPAGVAAGQVDDRLLAAIDLGPTMLSLVGAPVPPAMQGRIFLGPQTAPARAVVCGGRDRCDETEIVLRTARDARYRYILNLTPGKSLMSPNEYKSSEYPDWNLLKALAAEGKATPAQALFAGPTAPAEELYDLESDPGQLHNLAADPACQAIKARLAAALQTWRQEIHDPAL